MSNCHICGTKFNQVESGLDSMCSTCEREADEIHMEAVDKASFDRLTAELSEWKAKAQALEIERNTLRTALQVISDSLGHPPSPPFPVPTWRALSAAYAALRGKE